MAERVVDMSIPKDAAAFINALRKLRGRYRFDIRKHRARRSDRQNRYYWPCFVHVLGGYLRDQGETTTDNEAHEILKHKFLQMSVMADHATGEMVEYTRSTTELDTSEFNEYLDRCAHWLSDFFGIIVPEPSEYRETQETASAEHANTA